MEQYENEDKGISLGDIFRTIFTQKWLALIIAVVITVVGTVGMYLYGKSKENYSVTFVMQLPDAEESPTTYIYPDGTRFHYTDLISENYLETVKASDDIFANIDIRKMREYGDISIKRELLETATGSNTYVANYTLAIKSSYFKNDDTAREFIMKLVEMPREYFATMQLSYDAYLVASADVLAYDKKIDYLQSQASYLISRYNSFISAYGEDMVANGKMLSAYRSAINVLFDNEVFEKLKSEARLNGYVVSLEAADEYYSDSNFQNLNEQLKIERDALDNLLSVNTDTSSSSVIISGDKVVEQTRLVGELELEIKYFNNFKDIKNVSEQFNQSVGKIESQIKTFTDEFKDVAQSVYLNITTVSYEKANIVEPEGGMGIVMSILISLVAGIIIAAVVAYIVGRCRQNKAVKAPSEQAFPEGQMILQTAVTKDEGGDGKEDKE